MPPPTVESVIPKRPSAYRWLWFLAAVALGIAGLVVGVLRDEMPYDAFDLKPRARTLPDADNALLVFRAIAIERAPDTKSETYQADLDQALEHSDVWDETAANRLVSVRPDLWPRFDAALRLPHAEVPLPKSIKDVPPPHFGDMQNLWRIAALRARLLAHTQSADTGLALAVSQLESLRVQTDAGGTLIDYLSTAAYRGQTLRNIELILRETRPSAPALREALLRLHPARPSPEALAETFRAEHAFSIMALSEIKHTLATANQSGMSGFYEQPPFCVTWFFKPNQTIRLFAENTRAALPLIGQPLPRLTDVLIRQPAKPSAALFGRIPNPDNALGRYALGLIGNTYSRVLKIWLRDQTRYSAIEAALAVTCFQRDHGTFPDTLAALVPAYLPEVPRDYFDGAPIRYSRDLGVLWSVGENNLVVTEPNQELQPKEIIVYLTSRPRPSAK